MSAPRASVEDRRRVSDMDEDTRIGARIRKCRLWRGMTQQQLAELVGWTKTSVSLVENGHRGIDSRRRLRLIADALRVSPSDLTGQPYDLDTPGLAEAQAYVPAMESALLDQRIGDSADHDPRGLDELAVVVAGPLDVATRAGDEEARLALLPELLVDIQAHGRDERALRMLAHVGGKAAHALRFIGQVPLAWIAAERAAEAAAAVGDPVLVGAAEYVRAHARPQAARALQWTTTAADRIPDRLVETDRRAGQVYGMLRLSAALAAQVRGDTAEAAAQAGEADRVAGRLGDQVDAWEYFGPTNATLWEVTRLVEAGEPERALERAEDADTAVLPRERVAMLMLDRARAHYQLGVSHARQAVGALRQAEQLASVRMRASPWARDLVEVMLGKSRREAGGRDLRALAYRMGLEA